MLQKVRFIFYIFVLVSFGCNSTPEISLNIKKLDIDIKEVYALTDEGILVALTEKESIRNILIYDIVNEETIREIEINFNIKSCYFLPYQKDIVGTFEKMDGTREIFILSDGKDDVKLPKLTGHNPIIYDSNDRLVVGKYQNALGQEKPFVMDYNGKITDIDFLGAVYKISEDNVVVGKIIDDGQYFFFRGNLSEGIFEQKPCQEYSSILDINSSGKVIVQDNHIFYQWRIDGEMQEIELDNMTILSAEYADNEIIATCLSDTSGTAVSVYIDSKGDIFSFTPEVGVVSKTCWDRKHKSVFGYIVNNGVFYWKPIRDIKYVVKHPDWKKTKYIYMDSSNNKGDVIVRVGKLNEDSVTFYYATSPINQ